MDIKKLFVKLKYRWRILWEQKVFRYTVLIHGFFIVLSFILTLVFFRDRNDFRVYYRVGELFLTDINGLYDPSNYTGMWPFRYFPISAIFFVPLYLLGFDLGFIVFTLLNLLLNVLVCRILYKILIQIRQEDHEKDDKRIIMYICLFLMGLPNLFNYILGQINLYVTLLILLSLYLFLTREDIKWDLIASIILGLSIIIKPITIFMIPFLLVLKISYKPIKFQFKAIKSLLRIIGVISPLALNVLFFLFYPTLWEGFLAMNFTGGAPVQENHSFSLTKNILNFLYFYSIPHNPLFVFLIILLILGGIGFFVYVLRRIVKYSIIFGYLFGILIMLLVYFDSWTHHLLVLTPILIILVFYFPRNSKITKKYVKPSFFFLSFFDLAFMGIWWITQNFFPFNFVSTIFLLIILYGIKKDC